MVPLLRGEGGADEPVRCRERGNRKDDKNKKGVWGDEVVIERLQSAVRAAAGRYDFARLALGVLWFSDASRLGIIECEGDDMMMNYHRRTISNQIVSRSKTSGTEPTAVCTPARERERKAKGLAIRA